MATFKCLFWQKGNFITNRFRGEFLKFNFHIKNSTPYEVICDFNKIFQGSNDFQEKSSESNEITIRQETSSYAFSWYCGYREKTLDSDTNGLITIKSPCGQSIEIGLRFWNSGTTLTHPTGDQNLNFKESPDLGEKGYSCHTLVDTFDKHRIMLVSNRSDSSDDTFSDVIFSLYGGKCTGQDQNITSDIYIDILCLSDWMGRVFEGNEQKQKSLHQIFIPGTHDSATYRIESENLQIAEKEIEESPDKAGVKLIFDLSRALGDSSDINKILQDASKAQDHTIRQQLKDGIRFFDLRPCVKAQNSNGTPEIWISHSFYSVKLKEALDEIKYHLTKYRKEIVILDFRYLWGFKRNDSYYTSLFQLIEEILGVMIIKNDTLLEISTLWEKGKNILLWGSEEFINAYSKYTSEQAISSENCYMVLDSGEEPKIAGDGSEPTAESRIEKISDDINQWDNSDESFSLVKCEITPDFSQVDEYLKRRAINSLDELVSIFGKKVDNFSLESLAKDSIPKMVSYIVGEWSKNENIGRIFTFDYYHSCEVVAKIIELNDRF